MANFTSSYSTDPTDLNDFLNSTIWVEELCKELGAKSVTDVARDILVAAASEVTNPGSISSTRLLMGAIEVARNINSRRHADEDAVVLNCLGRILATEPSIAGNFEQLRISYRLQRNEGKSRKTVEVTTHAAGILSHAVLIRRSRYGAPTLTADAILAAIIGYPDGRFHKALAERGFSPKSLGKIVQRAIESVDAEYPRLLRRMFQAWRLLTHKSVI